VKLPQTGGCQCGNIRYEITEAPQLVYTCESSANLTWLLGIARRGRSPGPFFVGMRLIPPMCGSKLTDGGPRSLSRNQ
jgi:hypothetical protein